MAKKTTVHVVCDICHKEAELMNSHLPNKKMYIAAVEAVGFVTNGTDDFCSVSCKEKAKQ